MNDKLSISQAIKAEALRLGFYVCGITSAHPVGKRESGMLRQWLDKDYHAGLKYMEGHIEKRCDPCLLVEDAKSIICVALNYYPAKKLSKDQLQFAYYAYGKDYHEVMKCKLKSLYDYINNELLPINGRVFCDTAPVLERYWAQQAGLGWIGKHTQLIIPEAGSYFFLGELVVDAELTYDTPVVARCGSCTQCLNACPAQALRDPYVLDCNRCLSYLTIENKGEINAEGLKALGNRIYGCDECQKACPWNRFAQPCDNPELQPSEEFMDMRPEDWKNLSVEKYQKLFKGSAVKRAKYDGLIRNIKAVDNK